MSETKLALTLEQHREAARHIRAIRAHTYALEAMLLHHRPAAEVERLARNGGLNKHLDKLRCELDDELTKFVDAGEITNWDANGLYYGNSGTAHADCCGVQE